MSDAERQPGRRSGGAVEQDREQELSLRRAEQRRRAAQRVGDHAPQEGVPIFRPVERAVLVAVHSDQESRAEVDAGLAELAALCDTAGSEAADQVVQRRPHPDPATYVGRGKIVELRELAHELEADAVIVDAELSPAQQRNLEERLELKVLDRTIVILDIFAQHASSKEGKAQVELAQLSYLLPRLRGWGDALSRQAGGIGTRGPGESQLEVDRRKLSRRIDRLRAELREAGATRRRKTKERERAEVPTVALVGYTNAGKSTLLNRLTGASVEVGDRLFATLDTTARRLELPRSREAILTDTVGFVDKLPTQLVESFKSTLEETLRADLLLHVVDASHPQADEQMAAVERVLDEIGAEDMPRLVALNKADLADPDALTGLQREAGGVPVSAITGAGLDALRAEIAESIPVRRKVIEALVPYDHADLVARAHEEGEVLEEEHRAEGTRLVADVGPQLSAALAAYAEADPWAGDRDGSASGT